MAVQLLLIAALASGLGGQAPAGAPFTQAQAAAGDRTYSQKCAGCHGAGLNDGTAPQLAGPSFLDTWTAPGRTLDDLFFVLRSTMPKGEAGSLTTAEYVSVLAHILERNGYRSGDRELTPDQSALAAVKLTRPATAAADTVAAPPAFIAGPGGTIPRASGPSHDELTAGAAGRDWPMHTHDYSGTRYSPLAQITTANVAQLRPVCVYQAAETGNFQTGPVVHRGTMYVTSVAATIALDAATCRPKWRHVWTPRAAEPFSNNRGVAVKDGRVVRGTADGYLIALDAEDGRLLWARYAADTANGETFTMAPLVYDNLIIIGPAVSDHAIKGWIGAFRLDNGEPVWRFKIVPAAGEPGSETWSQPEGFPVGGGGLWTTPTLDPDRGLVYVATGNPAPDLTPALRGGANLYTNSVLALNIRTGALAWYRQLVPADSHDWDLTHASPLYRATIGGRPRMLIGIAGKDGMLRALDRTSQERLFETPVTTVENADAPVTAGGTHACPGFVGGVQWNGPAYHPRLNLLVVPAVDWCATFYADAAPRFIPNVPFWGGRVVNDKTSRGWITAVDASTGAVRWKYESPRPVVAAVTTTAGGLIFAGELTNDFIAFDAATGGVRFRYNTGGPIGGGIVTYEVAGRQYVAVASGRAAKFFSPEHAGSPTVLVFALGTPQASR